MRILIVEDHLKINELLGKFTRSENHQVVQTFSVEEAFDQLGKRQFDLVITDLMLPKLSGEDLIKKIREFSDIYIIVISAKTEITNKIEVLKLGADDYLTKPFSVRELLAKLENIEKRISQVKPVIYSYFSNELVVNPLNRKIILKGEIVNLTKYEYDIFLFLVENPHQVFSREQIIEHLFSESEAYDRVIDVYIKNIRKALADSANQPRYIKTHYGLGYQFVGEIDD